MISMNMPLAVGLVLFVMFLVVFSGWFVSLVDGWMGAVLDDKFWGYRIAGAGLLSIFVATMTWTGLSIKESCKLSNTTERPAMCEEIYKYEQGLAMMVKLDIETNSEVQDTTNEDEFIFSTN